MLTHSHERVSVSSIQEPDHTGWMLKEGGSVKNWKRRYFILKGNLLYYFKDIKDQSPTGVVSITFNTVVKKYDNVKKGRHSKFLISIDTHDRIYYVHPATEAEQIEWLNVLFKTVDSLKERVKIGNNTRKSQIVDPKNGEEVKHHDALHLLEKGFQEILFIRPSESLFFKNWIESLPDSYPTSLPVSLPAPMPVSILTTHVPSPSPSLAPPAPPTSGSGSASGPASATASASASGPASASASALELPPAHTPIPSPSPSPLPSLSSSTTSITQNGSHSIHTPPPLPPHHPPPHHHHPPLHPPHQPHLQHNSLQSHTHHSWCLNKNFDHTKMIIEVSVSACLDKFYSRAHAAQHLMIQRMVNFFIQKGLSEIEIDHLNDIGYMVNPEILGSFVGFCLTPSPYAPPGLFTPGKVLSGWYFPVEVPLKEAIRVPDDGPGLSKLVDFCERFGFQESHYLGRNLIPSTVTEFKLPTLIGEHSGQWLERIGKMMDFLEFPSFSYDVESHLRDYFPGGYDTLLVSVGVGIEGVVSFGVVFPGPERNWGLILGELVHGNVEKLLKFEHVIGYKIFHSVELRCFKDQSGKDIEVLFHYKVGEDNINPLHHSQHTLPHQSSPLPPLPQDD